MKFKSLIAAVLGCAAFLSAETPGKAQDAALDQKTLAAQSPATRKGKITGVDLRGTWVADADLRKLNKLPDLQYLDLSLTHITDQGMQEIKNLPAITELDLHFAEYVTDEGLAAIKGWKKLKKLNIHGTKVSDTTLEHISGLTTLESLNVGSVMLTDVGLEGSDDTAQPERTNHGRE